MNAIIRAIEYYLPESILSNADLEKEFKDWNSEKIEKKVGIRERHIVKEGETALDLAFAAGSKVLKNYDRNKIDFLLLCTQSADYYLPSSACILQEKLGLNTSTGALDFNQGCSGYIYGLALSKGIISAGIAKSVLLITAETYTKHIHPKDKGNRTIFGDAAAATIIEVSETQSIYKIVVGTDGKGAENLIVRNGGLRNRFQSDAKEIIDENGSVRTDNNLYMNGPEIFNFTIENIPKVYSEVLNVNEMTINDIDLVIFHQANKYMVEYLRNKLNIPEEKFYLDMLKVGNTVSSTIPIALKESITKRLVKKGSKVLLLGFGVGYSWGGTIIEI